MVAEGEWSNWVRICCKIRGVISGIAEKPGFPALDWSSFPGDSRLWRLANYVGQIEI